MLNEEIVTLVIKEHQKSCIMKLYMIYFEFSLYFKSDIPMFEKIAKVSAQRFEKIYKKRLMENYLC